MGETDDIAERPNLPFMSVAGKHQACTLLGSEVNVPRGMRNQHSRGCPRPASECLPYEITGFSGVGAAGQVVNTCQYEAWFHLSPAVVKHFESGVLEHTRTTIQTAGMKLMVPSHCPHTERGGEASQ